MWEKLGYESVDPSVLSRVVSGERTFTFRQLAVFSQILKIRKENKNRLKRLLYQDLADRFGLEEDFFKERLGYFVDLAKSNTDLVVNNRIRGLPELAIEQNNTLREKIDQEISLTKKESARTELYKVMMVLVHERLCCDSEVLLPEEIVPSAIEMSKQLTQIGENIKNRELIGLAKYLLGNAYYISGNYTEAKNLSLQAIKEGLSRDFLLFPLRTLAISGAYLGKEGDFKNYKKTIKNDLDLLVKDDQCLMLEVLGRGEMLLGNHSDAKEDLLQCWNVWEDIVRTNEPACPLRYVQLVRTEFIMAGAAKSSTRKNQLEDIGKKALAITKQRGYNRHEPELTKLLNEALN